MEKDNFPLLPILLGGAIGTMVGLLLYNFLMKQRSPILASNRNGPLAAGTSQTILDAEGDGTLVMLNLGSNSPGTSLNLIIDGTSHTILPSLDGTGWGGSTSDFLNTNISKENAIFKLIEYDANNKWFSYILKAPIEFHKSIVIKCENPTGQVANLACNAKYYFNGAYRKK